MTQKGTQVDEEEVDGGTRPELAGAHAYARQWTTAFVHYRAPDVRPGQFGESLRTKRVMDA